VSQPASGLRLRLFAGVLGAGLFASAVLAIALLLAVRDELYARRIADAREQLRAELSWISTECAAAAPGAGGSDRRACVDASIARLSRQLATPGEPMPLSRSDGPCVAPTLRVRASALLCEELPSGGALHLAVPLEPVGVQLRALDERMLAALAAALFLSVLLSLVLLERGVVRRLRESLEALQGLEEPGERALLPEGGDALGRLGGAVNRLGARLAEERARTQAQIVSLQAANRALAQEQQALREARADLSRSERLASAGRLAAGVAHEVGNPLSAVIAYAALLRERLASLGGPELGEPQAARLSDAQQFAERIERESSRVDRILRDLLDLARPRQPVLEPIALGAALGAARALLEPQPVFAGIALSLELPGDLPRVQGEEHYVVQVLVNLFTNAAKAGAKSIGARAVLEPAHVRLEILDDGSGIPAELLPRLFEPFVTSAAPGQGTGLGLALSHATMERIGGSISARANPPRGAVFTLRFLRADA